MTDLVAKLCSAFIMSVLASISSLVASTESIHSFTKLLADVHIEPIGLHLNVRTPTECGQLCADRIGDERPCEGYSFRTGNGTNECQLYTGDIQQATGPGKWVYRRELNNSNKYHGNFTFFVPPVKLNYTDAREYCLSHGAYLWHIDSLDDYQIITDTLNHPDSYFFIGVNDLETEGTFSCDRDGEPVDPSLLIWRSGEPNDYRYAEDCGILNRDSSIDKLADYSCHYVLSFICEKRRPE